ncbi:hypothetical protein JZ751_006108 [Albula glossodonta]|uniref:SH2 domain-containing protein n=1 Tax=Albula glossodonta TaxID=121402 RepID=A0A8T2P7F2_9TELE|nr:hypothetical protein JZ751_006108 [Albula glossodonta]
MLASCRYKASLSRGSMTPTEIQAIRDKSTGPGTILGFRHLEAAATVAPDLPTSLVIDDSVSGSADFKRFFGELRGSTIFLYADDTQDTYSEKVELCNLRAMVADTPRTKTCLSVYTLTLLHEEIQLKLEIPCTMQLLPGQMMRLEQVLEQERQRTTRPIQPIPSDPCCQRPCPLPPSFSVSTEAYNDTLSHVPPCFFSVSRQEAEQMLEMNPERGSIILRPATDNVTVPSLTAVVDHFLKTLPCLQPYIQTEAYDTCIGAFREELHQTLQRKDQRNAAGWE